MSASSSTGDQRASQAKGGGEVRGNPLFANTGGERRKIRPPTSDPTAVESGEQQAQLPEKPEVQATPASSDESPATALQLRRPPPPREMGETRFDEFYTKKTMHFIPILLERFDALAKNQRKSKTRLFNEAIAGVLASYGVLDEETRQILKEFGIEVQV